MGYSAHIITQHRSYGSQVYFTWDDFERYFNHLEEEYNEDGQYTMHKDENTDYYEIDKEVISKEIERLKKLPPEDGFEQYGDVTNEDAITYLQDMLDEAPQSDGHVSLEWF